MIFWNECEYKTLASATGFRQISVKMSVVYPKWKDLDDYINSMYGWFQGEFDPTQFDEGALQELKREYRDGPIIQSEPISNLYIILTK